MKNKIKLLTLLAVIPMVLYATECLIDDAVNCVNVYPGSGPYTFSWYCSGGGSAKGHWRDEVWNAINQPQKHWVQWAYSNGSFGYITNFVYCIASAGYQASGYVCPSHTGPGTSYPPCTPISTGNAETNLWQDETFCTTD